MPCGVLFSFSLGSSLLLGGRNIALPHTLLARQPGSPATQCPAGPMSGSE